MKLTRSLALMAGAMALAAGAFAQEDLPTQKMLTVEPAQTIAQDAMARCRADGYKVTVTVVDSANLMKAFLRDDGNQPSGPPPNLPAGTPPPPPIIPGTTNAVGGVPIKVGDQLIGAVSVSGAPGGDKDAACANDALSKVAGKLKQSRPAN